MKVIAIDPGKTFVGWAAFGDDAELQKCGMLHVDDLEVLEARRPDAVVIEVPQVFQQRKWKGDPNDLIDVAFTAGMAAHALRDATTIERIRPSRWKGQRTKEVDNPFTIGLLSVAERQRLDACGVIPSKRHNVIDAVGIGLWKLGRR